MKQTREIKNFLFSQYFSDGLRITFGVLVPAFIFASFGELALGITFSLGALTISIADSPGPVVHKRNAMLVCLGFVVISGLLTGIMNQYRVLLLVELAAACFVFSMFNVYGNRASAIGTASLLIVVLTMDEQMTYAELVKYIGLIFGGGVWYMLFSLSISQILPYRLAQQSLAESVREVSAYVRLKAKFYNLDTDAEDNYRQLIAQQIVVHEHQDTVRELLFKSRLMVRESTSTGRQLVLVFVDVVDLFEQSMATHYDYQLIRNTFGKTGVLEEFEKVIVKVGDELENLSFYINSNQKPIPLHALQPDLEQLKASIDRVETEYKLNNLVLKKILINVRNMVSRIQKIYSYFNPKQLEKEHIRSEADLPKFVSHQDFDVKQFVNNLSLKSSVFRHSLRVTIASIAGYMIAQSLSLGHHSYWILLTIVVILKPGFSLTKQRNYHRIIGTVCGAIIGVGFLILVKDQTARFFFMMFLMIGSYSFQRLNYVVSVIFMTPYILILFSFLGAGNLNIAQERIFDTFLGSIIAFAASYFLFPNWESYQLKGYMRSLVIANYIYLLKTANALSGKTLDITDYKLARKNVYVSSANMASAFQRMLSEPKSKQKNSKDVHKFVVLNHMLSSYTANLISHLLQTENRLINPDHLKLAKRTLHTLSVAINLLHEVGGEEFRDTEFTVQDRVKLENDSQDNRLITEQLGFVNDAAGDILKLVEKMEDETEVVKPHTAASV
jgi:uncharacterized membrane protein (TIGR01666 family)